MNFRVITIIVVTIFHSIVSCLLLFHSLIAPTDILKAQDISAYERRFKALRQVIPPHEAVNYITDCRTDLDARFYVVQYSLCPVLVDNSTSHPLIVANFCSTGMNNGIIKDKNFLLLNDFGQGLMLFKRKSM